MMAVQTLAGSVPASVWRRMFEAGDAGKLIPHTLEAFMAWIVVSRGEGRQRRATGEPGSFGSLASPEESRGGAMPGFSFPCRAPAMPPQFVRTRV